MLKHLVNSRKICIFVVVKVESKQSKKFYEKKNDKIFAYMKKNA